MKNLLKSTLVTAITIALAACGGSSSNDSEEITPTTLEISGQAIKGTFAGALVEVFNADDLTVAIGSDAQTDEDGNYTVTITDEAGEPIVGAYVVQVSADEDSTMICDASVCGDIVRGGMIPAADLTDLTLSTFIYSDGTGNIEADVNALTTMATDALLAAASANENIELATLTQAGVTSLQLGASQVVGSLLGIDLSTTNIYNLDIIDATTFTADTVVDKTTNTLTFINASFSGLDNDVVTGLSNLTRASDPTFASAKAEGLGAVIANYLSTFKAIVALLVDPATATDVTAEQLAVITDTQTQFNTLVADIIVQVKADHAELEFEVETILTEVNLQDIIEAIAEIEAGTGGTSS